MADRSMKVTIIWYLMASMGEAPARIKPVIMPGRETMPRVLAESMVGTMPVFMASRIISMEAGRMSAPRASLLSTSGALSLKLAASCL